MITAKSILSICQSKNESEGDTPDELLADVEIAIDDLIGSVQQTMQQMSQGGVDTGKIRNCITFLRRAKEAL